MRIAVTGAAGTVGAPLCACLAAEHDVVAIDLSGAEVAVDVCDLPALTRAFAGCDAVVHLAGIAKFECSWEETVGPNLTGTYNAYEAARAAGCRRFIFASSHHVVGMYEIESAPALYREASGVLVTPASPLRPDSLYAAWKVFGEALGRVYSERHGMSVACIRIGTINKADDPRHDSVRLTSDFLGLSDEEKFLRYAATWMSHGDFARLVRCVLAHDVPFGIVYGVSDNARRFWDLEPGRALFGFWPSDGCR
jgi:nucleoside-diphosphate-sugar epimerase